MLYSYSNYAETPVNTGSTQPPCVKALRGSLNHIEVRVSATHVEVWMSDFSPDGGRTFPNFQRVFSADIQLPFARGYVHYQQAERAPIKYATEFDISPGYATNYWSGLGFDGPIVGGEVGYEVPDALTPGPGDPAAGASGALNLGYALLSSPQSTATCCANGARTTVPAFALPGVSLVGVSQTMLTFTVDFTFASQANPMTVGLAYRFNGKAWHTVAMPDMNAATYCSGCPQPAGPGEVPGVAFAVQVDASDLTTGTNTVEFSATGTWDSYPAVIGNIDLLTFK
jgi:hypothetical protein